MLFHMKGGSSSFGAKMALSLNGVDPGCMNPITGSTCRAKCSNILHDISYSFEVSWEDYPKGDPMGTLLEWTQLCQQAKT